MAMHKYTADEIAALTALADEARELDAAWRAVMDVAGAIVDRLYGFACEVAGKVERHVDPAWMSYEEAADLAQVVSYEFRVAPFAQLPAVDQCAYRRVARAADWRKLNNKCRKEIAQARAVVERYEAQA